MIAILEGLLYLIGASLAVLVLLFIWQWIAILWKGSNHD
jgi:hypothetical protein